MERFFRSLKSEWTPQIDYRSFLAKPNQRYGLGLDIKLQQRTITR